MIFGNRQSVVTEGYKGKMGFIIPTSECFDEIITESAKESYKIRAATYVSDILMEEAVMEGANAEVLLEGFGKDLWEKIKNMFKKLIAKIKEWYNAFKRALALMFTSGKEFVEKFEKELLKKTAKGYKYKTFKYTIAKGEAFSDKALTQLDAFKNAAVKGLAGFTGLDAEDLKDKTKVAAAISGSITAYHKNDEYDSSEAQDAVLSALNVDSVEELIDELKEACRNGETEPEEFEDFEDCAKNVMIKTIKEGEKEIKNVEKFASKVDTEGNKIIRSLEKAQNSLKGETLSAATPAVNFLVEMMRWGIATDSSISKTYVTILKERMKSYETILKGYLRFKPVKESYSSVDEDGAESILESAMRFV